MIDLLKLARFVTLARTGSYARAARELHVTQSSLTRSIQSLESQLGLRLLDRSRGHAGISLTPAGVDLVRHGSDLLQGADRLKAEITASATRQRHRVSVGLGSVLVNGMLEDLLVTLLGDRRTDVFLSVTVGDPESMTSRLITGELDLYIGPATSHRLSSGIRSRFLGQLPTRLLVRAGHPLLAEPREPTIDHIVTYPIISDTAWQEAAELLGDRIDRRLFDVAVQIDSHAVLVNLARESDAVLVAGIGSLPDELVELGVGIDMTPIQTDILMLTTSQRRMTAPAWSVAEQLCVSFEEMVSQ